MAISEAFSGTETVTATEHSLTTDTAGPDAEASDGWFQLFVDLNALVAADVFELSAYEKVQAASTQRRVYRTRFSLEGLPIWQGPVLGLMHGWDFTLKKISGTDRLIDWSLRKEATIEQVVAVSELVSTIEHSLVTDTPGPDADTTDGWYQVWLDLNALAAGDVFKFTIYEKVLAASSQRKVFECVFAGVQPEPVAVTPVLGLLHGWDATLLKVAGTDRTIDTSIRKIA